MMTFHIRNIRAVTLGIVLGSTGCIQVPEEDDGQSDEDVAAAQQLLRSAAQEQREFTIASQPYADCELTSTGSDHSVPVVADGDGIVHLWAAPSGAGQVFTLECNEPSGPARYDFDLGDPAMFAPSASRAASRSSAPSNDRWIRPPLSDPESKSQSELTAAGYPPRPAPGTERYQQWLEQASRPITVIRPRVFNRGNRHKGPEIPDDNINWGTGLSLKAKGARYTDVYSSFDVPTCIAKGSLSMADKWIGLGGSDGSKRLIQAGVECESIDGVTYYSPWFEYYTHPTQYPGIAMGPGDQVYWEVWECSANGSYGPSSHGYGCFFWYNASRGTALFTQIVKIPSGTAFKGGSCDSVMESHLPDWEFSGWAGGTSIPFTCAADGNFTTRDLSTDRYENNTMVNDRGRTLGYAEATEPNVATMFWRRSK